MQTTSVSPGRAVQSSVVDATPHVSSQYWSSFYAQEIAELQRQRDAKNANYAMLQSKLDAEAASLASTRMQLEQERALRANQLAQVMAGQSAKQAELANLSTEHDKAITEATVAQRNLENSITEANVRLSVERAQQIAALEAAKQQQEIEQNKVNYMKHNQYLEASRVARDQRNLAANINTHQNQLERLTSVAVGRDQQIQSLYNPNVMQSLEAAPLTIGNASPVQAVTTQVGGPASYSSTMYTSASVPVPLAMVA